MVTANLQPFRTVFPFSGLFIFSLDLLVWKYQRRCDKFREGGLCATCSGFSIFPSHFQDPVALWGFPFPYKHFLCIKPRLISSKFVFFVQIADWVWLFIFSSTHLQSLSTLVVMQYHQRALSALWTATASLKHRACLASTSLVCNSNYRWGCQTTSYYRSRLHGNQSILSTVLFSSMLLFLFWFC